MATYTITNQTTYNAADNGGLRDGNGRTLAERIASAHSYAGELANKGDRVSLVTLDNLLASCRARWGVSLTV